MARKYKSTPWMDLNGATTIKKIAAIFGWSELAVWNLVRKRIIRWGVHRQEVVVSLAEVRDWAEQNPEISKRLQNPKQG